MSDRKHFSGIGWGYFIFISVTIGLSLLLKFIITATGFELPSHLHWMALFISMAPMYLVAAPLAIYRLKKVPKMEPEEKTKLGAGRFLVIFIIGIAAMQIGNLIGQTLMGIAGRITGNPMTFELQQIILDTEPWVIILLVVIIGPFMEELMFRKLLIDRVRMYGDKTAILLSGLLFGLFHGNFFQFFYAFFLGCIFGYVYCSTLRLRYTVLMHMIINFMGSVVVIFIMNMPGMDRFLDPSVVMNEENMMELLKVAFPGILLLGMYGMFLLCAVIAGIVLFLCFFKQIRLN